MRLDLVGAGGNVGARPAKAAKPKRPADSTYMKTFILTSIVLGGLCAASIAATPEEINAANATRTQTGATPRDGFTLRGTELVMTYHGVTSKVEHDYVLSDGTKVRANGNIVFHDGSTTSLRPNQILLFDGEIQEAILTPDGVAPLAGIAEGPRTQTDFRATSRDGITVANGVALITRDGVTEKITSDVRLANGAVVKSDGTVVFSNGNSLSLNPNQFLDLDGVLHDMRARPAARLRDTAPR